MLEFYRLQFSQGVVLFSIYSCMGWMVEVVYRSMMQKRFVNAGFLVGPFTPIYGIAAILIVALSLLVPDFPFAAQIIFFALMTLLLEFAVGVGVEKVFGFRLWDYSENRFNYRGIVCAKYVVLWTILSLIFIYGIHPFVYSVLSAVPNENVVMLSYILLIYFAVDTSLSVIMLSQLKNKISLIVKHYVELSNQEIRKKLDSTGRIFNAYPDLHRLVENKIGERLKERLNGFIGGISNRIAQKDIGDSDAEFFEMLNEISSNSEYRRLKDFYHHHSSIYDHILEVAYLTYKVSRNLRLDYRSATRGALLHDFFCYDWRNHDEPDLARNKFHGLHHPRIALANSEKHFPLNDIERDIISKHMWPLTFMPPRYKESFVVTFVDKYVASREYSVRLRRYISHRVRVIRAKTGKFKNIIRKKIG